MSKGKGKLIGVEGDEGRAPAAPHPIEERVDLIAVY